MLTNVSKGYSQNICFNLEIYNGKIRITEKCSHLGILRKTLIQI